MLLIYSGGMDSTVLLHEFKNEIKLAISFNYGSKHNNREFEMAKWNCEKLKITHKRIDLKDIFENIKSDLLKSGGEIPEGHYEDESMKKTVVPFRNGIMLSIACGIAESNGLKKVAIANHFGDHAIYPDCRDNFIKPFSEACQNGTYENIEIFAPYTKIDKRDIGLKGQILGVDFAKTYTCYKGQETHCGKCGSCTERKESLHGFDNTKYDNNN